VNDQAHASAASRADVALVHDGPMMATLRIRTTMAVPAEFDFGAMVRSPHRVDLVIDSQVTLRRGVDRLEVSTTVNNAAGDHRLRVLFPSGAGEATTYLADSPYDIVERPIALREDNHLYRELEVETRPQQSWTAVYGAGRGLAVLADGLLETAVRDLPERPVALTLFRATRRTVMTDGEPGGQLIGPLSFRYWLVPLSGEPDRTRLSYLGQQLAAGLRAVPMSPRDVAMYRGRAELSPSAGLLETEGPAVVTSVRRTAGALEVRFFNPLTTPATAMVRLGAAGGGIAGFSQAQRVNLESAPLAEPEAVESGALEVSMRPKEIVTLRLT
jgi:alpha-mannosidase/mannosylglycerate hydrolase